jgi:hypothetical protein
LGPSQRILLASHLRNPDYLTEEIDRLSSEIEQQLSPSHELLQRLDTIPGVGERVAHLASWARECPSNDESAGNRLSSHIGPGNPWLPATLVEAAWAVTLHMPRADTSLHSTAASPPGGDTDDIDHRLPDHP